MYNIQVKSRTDAISYSYHFDMDEYVMISITDPVEKLAKFCHTSKLKDVLRLQFNDADRQYADYVTLMDEEHGKELKKFIDDWKGKVNNIVVHCYAGISRSSAIACAISRYLNGDDMDIWGQGKYSPNLLCYRVACKSFGIEVTEEEIEARRDANEYAFDIWDKENDNVVTKMFI